MIDDKAICIWCKQAGRPWSVEHIIPESLGCPKGFELTKGEVCKACNNGLGHLDRAVAQDFDFLSYMAGVPRKKNRSAEIRSRGNVVATTGSDGRTISINMERHSVVAHDGSHLAAYGGSNRNINAKFEHDGQLAGVSYEVPFGQNPLFVRGIVKIALTSLTYFLGSATALNADFDPVREYVKHGKGDRPILLCSSPEGGYCNRVLAPYKSESGQYYVLLRLAMTEFCVDLSPSVEIFPMLKEKLIEMSGNLGWTYLPTDFKP